MAAVADGGEPEEGRRMWAAYRRANFMIAHAGITLTSAGVSPNSPEVQAIRKALRALNQASGLDGERKEENRVNAAGGPRYGTGPFEKSA
jgi:hypothetical protein